MLPNSGYQTGGLALSSVLKIVGINNSDSGFDVDVTPGSASALPTGNPVSIKIALSDAGWERLTPVKGYEKQENEHEVEREQRARLCHSSKTRASRHSHLPE